MQDERLDAHQPMEIRKPASAGQKTSLSSESSPKPAKTAQLKTVKIERESKPGDGNSGQCGETAVENFFAAGRDGAGNGFAAFDSQIQACRPVPETKAGSGRARGLLTCLGACQLAVYMSPTNPSQARQIWQDLSVDARRSVYPSRSHFPRVTSARTLSRVAGRPHRLHELFESSPS